jgi:hypothetical protein
VSGPSSPSRPCMARSAMAEIGDWWGPRAGRQVAVARGACLLDATWLWAHTSDDREGREKRGKKIGGFHPGWSSTEQLDGEDGDAPGATSTWTADTVWQNLPSYWAHCPHAPTLVSKTSDDYACAPDNLTGSVRVSQGPRINYLQPGSQD